MELRLEQNEATKFRRIKFFRSSSVIKGHFPDFLVLGPQRTGTTWLAKQMAQHPDIFMAFPKELYFFSRTGKRYSKHYSGFSVIDSLKAPGKGLRETLKVIYFDLLRTGKYPADSLEWYLQFFKNDLLQKMINKSLKGKTACFGELIKGEATASYAALEPELIEEIHMLNPNLKVIIMVRDPVSRTWSHAKKDLLRNKGKKISQVPDVEFEEFFLSEYQQKANKYSQHIENWSRVLGRNNVFIGLFDQIKDCPSTLLNRIFRFLEIPGPKEGANQNLEEKVNLTSMDAIPAKYKRFLEAHYQKEIAYIDKNRQYWM